MSLRGQIATANLAGQLLPCKYGCGPGWDAGARQSSAGNIAYVGTCRRSGEAELPPSSQRRHLPQAAVHLLCTFCIHISGRACLPVRGCRYMPHLAARHKCCLCSVSDRCPWKPCRYVPLGLIWNPGQYPTNAAGYDDITHTIRTWVLTRLAWMEGQFRQVGYLSRLHQDSGSGQ